MPNYTYKVPIYGEAIIAINADSLAEADEILLESGGDYEVESTYNLDFDEAELIGRDTIGE